MSAGNNFLSSSYKTDLVFYLASCVDIYILPILDKHTSVILHFLCIYIYIYIYIYIHWAIGLMSRVFANGLEDQGSILGRVIPKTQKMVLDAALLNTQHYKGVIKGKGRVIQGMV